MPAGYEKMRDSFIRQGLSEEDAKEKAARIWNSKHKGAEAVGGHYDEKNMSALEKIIEFARVTPGRERGGSGLSLHAIQDTTFLGLKDEAYDAAEGKLQAELMRLSGRKKFTVPPIPALPSAQQRVPLAAPVATHPLAPGAGVAEPDVETQTKDYLKWLKSSQPLKKKRPGGKGWFPERGDIRDF